MTKTPSITTSRRRPPLKEELSFPEIEALRILLEREFPESTAALERRLQAKYGATVYVCDSLAARRYIKTGHYGGEYVCAITMEGKKALNRASDELHYVVPYRQ